MHNVWQRRQHWFLEDRVARLAAALAADPPGPDPPLLLEPLKQRQPHPVPVPQEGEQAATLPVPQQAQQAQQAQQRGQQQQLALAQQREAQREHQQAQARHAQQPAPQAAHVPRAPAPQQQQRPSQPAQQAQQGLQLSMLQPARPAVQQQPRPPPAALRSAVAHSVEPVKAAVAQLPVSPASRSRRTDLLTDYQKMLEIVGGCRWRGRLSTARFCSRQWVMTLKGLLIRAVHR